MRCRPLLVIGALAFVGAGAAGGASAQTANQVPTEPTPTTAPTTTSTTSPRPATTQPPPPPPPPPPSPGTTAAPTTTTTVARGPKPPPASGASQPLDPSLLGGLPGVDLNPSTTIPSFSTDSGVTTTTVVNEDTAISVASNNDGPSGTTLILASVAWIASLGGLLVYAEEQRSKQWQHLAR